VIGILPAHVVGAFAGKILGALLGLEVPFHVEQFVVGIDEAERMTAETVQVPVAIGSTAIGEENSDLMERFRRQRPEIPHHRGRFQIGLRVALLGMDKVAKFQRVADEKDRRTLGELHDEPFLLLRGGHCFRETAVAACKRARVQPKIIFESGQFSSILSMVCAGLGVSIIPAMALEKRNGCHFVPLEDGRATRAIGAVTLNGRSLSRAQQAFLSHLTATKIADSPTHLTP
jgi:DNA-binding transcriptional LysR family regulator